MTSRKACPRLKTKPIASGKCPDMYLALQSAVDPEATCCKRKRLFPLRRNKLRSHGYSSGLRQSERRAALKSAVSEYGPLSVFRKLNAIMVLNKRKPRLHSIFRADRNWVRKMYLHKAQVLRDAKVKSEPRSYARVKKERESY